MKMTKAAIDRIKLPPGKSEVIVFDDTLPGFGLRVRAGGKRTWIAQYRSGAKQRRLTLGTVEKIDPDKARVMAKAAFGAVAKGQDPQAEKRAARAPRPREMTLGELVEQYLPRAEQRLKPGSYAGVVIHLRKHWKPLHSSELRNIERRHVAAELARIAKNSGPTGANRSRAALSALFAWAIGEGLASANPVVGTNKATDEVARDRVLTPEELRLAWQHAGAGDYGAIVRLLILTGQRREEVGSMRWDEIDLEGRLWMLPKERTKNGRPHEILLSEPAIAILKALPRRPGREFVFGSKDGPFQGWSRAKEALDERMGVGSSALPWRLHDIRRTVATRLADAGVLPHVIEAILNHISGHRAGVAGIYNRAVYSEEKREALERWAEFCAKMAETRKAA